MFNTLERIYELREYKIAEAQRELQAKYRILEELLAQAEHLKESINQYQLEFKQFHLVEFDYRGLSGSKIQARLRQKRYLECVVSDFENRLLETNIKINNLNLEIENNKKILNRERLKNQGLNKKLSIEKDKVKLERNRKEVRVLEENFRPTTHWS